MIRKSVKGTIVNRAMPFFEMMFTFPLRFYYSFSRKKFLFKIQEKIMITISTGIIFCLKFRKKNYNGQDKTGQDMIGQDRTGKDRTGKDRIGKDRTG